MQHQTKKDLTQILYATRWHVVWVTECRGAILLQKLTLLIIQRCNVAHEIVMSNRYFVMIATIISRRYFWHTCNMPAGGPFGWRRLSSFYMTWGISSRNERSWALARPSHAPFCKIDGFQLQNMRSTVNDWTGVVYIQLCSTLRH